MLDRSVLAALVSVPSCDSIPVRRACTVLAALLTWLASADALPSTVVRAAAEVGLAASS
jgi:hypothetical protein